MKIIFFEYKNWGLGIGDWGLGIGDWAQSPIPISISILLIIKLSKFIIIFLLIKNFFNMVNKIIKHTKYLTFFIFR
jgi:hypothetical protein